MKNNRFELLGINFKKARKSRYPRDTQQDFADRLAISIGTVKKMDAGDMSVSFITYYRAAQLLKLDTPFDHLFEKEESLFDDS